MDLMSVAVPFGAVLAGGAVSVVGSVYVNRSELTRRQRIRIFLDLAPQLHRAVEALLDDLRRDKLQLTAPLVQVAQLVSREATVAGGVDAEMGRAIADTAETIHALNPLAVVESVYEPPDPVENADALRRLLPLVESLYQYVDKFEKRLAAKIR